MSVFSKLTRLVSEELGALHPTLEAVKVVNRFVPTAVRGRLLERVGFRIGEGTSFLGQPRITGGARLPDNLIVGRECVIEHAVTFDLEERITLGDRVTLGHEVMILTSTHELGPPQHRAGDVTRAPVSIGDGAWVGARAIVLPGVNVGAGAVVAPGALVNKNVEPNTRVAGTPARVVETLG
jgi:maltose O-acetyltransferase